MVTQGSIDSRAMNKKEEEVAIFNYLDARLVLFLEVNTRNEALSQLTDLLDREKKLIDKQTFLHAILEREKIVSTGIGIGVAIPHAKLAEYSDFFIAIGIQKQRGIDWNALDGSLVRIIFLIGGPENQQTRYLKILSKLTLAIKDEQRRKNLLKARSSRDVIQVFQGL